MDLIADDSKLADPNYLGSMLSLAEKLEKLLPAKSYCEKKRLKRLPQLLTIPHNFSLDNCNQESSLLDEVFGYTFRILEQCQITKFTETQELIHLSPVVRVGPKTAELIDTLQSLTTEKIEVTSGYRSIDYQAVLFADALLSGNLRDEKGRLLVLPPGYSCHNYLDTAIDVSNSCHFMLALMKLHKSNLVQAHLPYLHHPEIAYEPWHWNLQFHTSSLNRDAKKKEALFSKTTEEMAGMSSRIWGGSAGSKSTESSYVHIGEYKPVFVKGISSSGASSCYGRLEDSTYDSIQLATEDVGSGWDCYYISVPIGYTPVYDKSIHFSDIGRFTFKASDKNGQAYITAQSTIFDRVNTPEKLTNALVSKLNGNYEFLEKSLELEFLKSEGILLPAKYALPYVPYESTHFVSTALVKDFYKWLEFSSRNVLPPFFSGNYGNYIEKKWDIARYGLLFKELSWWPNLTTNLIKLRENLLRLLQQEFLDVEPIDNNKCIGLLFYLDGLVNIGLSSEADEIFERYELHISKLIETKELFLLGFACELALQDKLVGLNMILSKIVDWPKIPDSESRTKNFLIESRAYIQILLYKNRFLSSCEEKINGLIGRIISWPSSKVDSEFGAFSTLECFQSAIPLEALALSAKYLTVSNNEKHAYAKRTHAGLIYLRNLQFKSGVGFYSKNPEFVEGALAYSLLDHHYRIDYGIHAVSLAHNYNRDLEDVQLQFNENK